MREEGAAKAWTVATATAEPGPRDAEVKNDLQARCSFVILAETAHKLVLAGKRAQLQRSAAKKKEQTHTQTQTLTSRACDVQVAAGRPSMSPTAVIGVILFIACRRSQLQLLPNCSSFLVQSLSGDDGS